MSVGRRTARGILIILLSEFDWEDCLRLVKYSLTNFERKRPRVLAFVGVHLQQSVYDLKEIFIGRGLQFDLSVCNGREDISAILLRERLLPSDHFVPHSA